MDEARAAGTTARSALRLYPVPGRLTRRRGRPEILRACAPYTSDLAARAAPRAARALRALRADRHPGRARTHALAELARPARARPRARAATCTRPGSSDAAIDDNGYVTATLPATGADAPVIGLIAHMDTSPDAPGAGVEPIVHRGYDGGVIDLPRGETRLDPETMPELAAKHGHDIVTSSGDTLLGADDKAGVAEIVTAVAHLAAHPELPRPTLRVAFTPDEEIGLGPTLFDIEALRGAAAPTRWTARRSARSRTRASRRSRSGSPCVASTSIPGPPTASSSTRCACSRRSWPRCRPTGCRPRRPRAGEGFIHPHLLEGDAGRAELRVIVRDFDDDLLARARRAAAQSSPTRRWPPHPGARADFDVRDPVPQHEGVHRPRAPDRGGRRGRPCGPRGSSRCGTAIRGGTDGSLLSRDGAAHPQPVHRRPRVPLGPRVGLAQ